MGLESLGEFSSVGHGGAPGTSWDPEERVLDLTAIPSTNTLYNNIPGKGRRKTAAHKAWLFTAGWELKLQKVRPLPGPVHVNICLPDRPGRAPDADNVLKASIDLLVRHRLIDGDDKKVVRSVSVRWAEEISKVRITITRAAARAGGSANASTHVTEMK